MKAIAITRAAAEGSNIPFLTDIELPQPVAEGHDLLVEVKAISVNPVDTKVRAGFNAVINQVDTVTVDDEIIHRAQFAFPHDLTTAQIQRRQVTIISQRVNNAIDDNRSGINVAKTIDFRWACRLRDTLLPNHLALLHQHGAYATVITANNSCAKGGCRSGFATQRQRR